MQNINVTVMIIVCSQDLRFYMKEMLGFSEQELKAMLLATPRVYLSGTVYSVYCLLFFKLEPNSSQLGHRK